MSPRKCLENWLELWSFLAFKLRVILNHARLAKSVDART